MIIQWREFLATQQIFFFVEKTFTLACIACSSQPYHKTQRTRFRRHVVVISQPVHVCTIIIHLSEETNCRREISCNFFSVKNVMNVLSLWSLTAAVADRQTAAAKNKILKFHVRFVTCARNICSKLCVRESQCR